MLVPSATAIKNTANPKERRDGHHFLLVDDRGWSYPPPRAASRREEQLSFDFDNV
jgi:hypothetical protein